MDELNNIKVSIQEKNEIKKDSPDTLPLNPTAQGFSGAEIRRRLSKSITGEEGSVLSLLVDKMNIISDLFRIILDENLDRESRIDTLESEMDTSQSDIDSIESDIGDPSIANSIKGDIQSNRNEIINLSNSLLTIPLNSGTTINNAPKGVYATLALLQTAHPMGDTGVYVVAYDAKWYYWNGSNWVSGGIYQSMSLPNENDVVYSQIDLVSNNIYKVPSTLLGITLNLPTNKSSKFYAELHIQTGSSLSVSYSTSDIVWKGEDLDNDGEWIPSGTTSYLLQIKCNGEKYIINVLEV